MSNHPLNKQEKMMSDPETPIRTEALALESIETWRRQLARILLRALAAVGAPLVAVASYVAYTEQIAWQIPVYVGFYMALLIITFWRRVPYKMQAMVAMILLCGFGTFNITQFGVNAESAFFLLTVPFLAVLFYGKSGGRVGIIAICVILAVLAALFVTGQIVVYMTVTKRSTDLGGWLTTGLIFLMLSVALVFAQNYLFDHLVAALARSHELTEKLEKERSGLEEIVQERTRDLMRRTQYLQMTATIAHDTSSELDLQDLLSRVVALVNERFGFYHTGIFLTDPSREWAELRAASSEGGQIMLTQGHRLKIGAGSIVGYVAKQGAHRVALDVGEDTVHFNNPNLPDTRSEAALPLRARGEIIGVLDVQSTEPSAFSEEDVTTLQTLADQVAVAISNAQLFQRVEENVAAERRAYVDLSQQAWRKLLRNEVGLGFFSTAQGTTATAGDVQRPEMESALRTGQIVPGDDGTRLAIPIKVREQVIGVIDGRKPEGSGKWTPEEIELLQVLTERLSVALESARLYRNTQRREIQERTVGQVTARVRETLDIETMLKTAVQEVQQSLGLPEVMIRLATGLADSDSTETVANAGPKTPSH